MTGIRLNSDNLMIERNKANVSKQVCASNKPLNFYHHQESCFYLTPAPHMIEVKHTQKPFLMHVSEYRLSHVAVLTELVPIC